MPPMSVPTTAVTPVMRAGSARGIKEGYRPPNRPACRLRTVLGDWRRQSAVSGPAEADRCLTKSPAAAHRRRPSLAVSGHGDPSPRPWGQSHALHEYAREMALIDESAGQGDL